MAVIETERLTKRYGNAQGIEEVTVSIEQAEVFGFLGPCTQPVARRGSSASTVTATASRSALGSWLFERRDLSA